MTAGGQNVGLEAQLTVDASGIAPEIAQAAQQLAALGAQLGGQLSTGFANGFDTSGIEQGLTTSLNNAAANASQIGQNIGDQIAQGISQSDPLGNGLGNGGGGGGGAGGAAATAAGTALGVVIGEAASAAMEKSLEMGMDAIGEVFAREAGSDKLAAQVRLDPKQAATAGAAAGAIYANNFGEDAAQINDAIKAQMTEGILDKNATQAEIEDTTERMLGMASTFDQEAADISRAVGQMLRTGMADSASEAMDLLTTGMQNGVNKADDIFDTFNEYSTNFRDIGLEGEMAMGLINQAMKAGARDSDMAAAALQEFSFVSKNADSAELFKELGLNGKEMVATFAKGGPEAAAALGEVLTALSSMKDLEKQAAIRTELFGAGEDMGDALYAMDPSKAVASLGQIAGAVDDVNEKMGSNDAATIETFKRGIETAFVEVVGGKVLPVVKSFGSALGLNSDSMSTLLTVLVPLAGVLLLGKVAMMGISAATATWTAVTKIAAAAQKVWTGIQWAWNAAMTANPIGLVILAIVALVAIFILAWKKSDTFREIVTGALDGVVEAAKGFWAFIQKIPGWIGGALTAAGNLFKGWGDRVVGYISGLKERAGGGFKGFVTAIALFVGDAIKAGAKLLLWWATLPFRILRKLVGLGEDLNIAGADVVAGFLDGIASKAGEVLDMVKSTLVDPVKNAITDAFDIHSPSRWAAEQSGYLMQGFGGGIAANARIPVSAALGMSDEVRNAMSFPPPTVAGVKAAAKANRRGRGAAGEPVGLLGGGNRTFAVHGPMSVYTGTPHEFIDEMTENKRFDALAPARG